MRPALRFALAVAATFAAVLWALPAQAATILRLSPESSIVPVGAEVTVDVLVEDVADLFGVQFDVGFDASILSFLGATRGPFLPVDVDANGDPVELFSAIDNGGLVTVFDSRACDVLNDQSCVGISGSGRLATLAFQAAGGGHSSLSLGQVLLIDPFLNVLEAETRGGDVQVTQVPAPGVSLMVGVGLLACRAWVRRRDRAR